MHGTLDTVHNYLVQSKAFSSFLPMSIALTRFLELVRNGSREEASVALSVLCFVRLGKKGSSMRF